MLMEGSGECIPFLIVEICDSPKTASCNMAELLVILSPSQVFVIVVYRVPVAQYVY